MSEWLRQEFVYLISWCSSFDFFTCIACCRQLSNRTSVDSSSCWKSIFKENNCNHHPILSFGFSLDCSYLVVTSIQPQEWLPEAILLMIALAFFIRFRSKIFLFREEVNFWTHIASHQQSWRIWASCVRRKGLDKSCASRRGWKGHPQMKGECIAISRKFLFDFVRLFDSCAWLISYF